MMTRTDLDSLRAYLADGTNLCPEQGYEIAIELLEEVERHRMHEVELAGEAARLRDQRDHYNEDAIRAHVQLARLRNHGDPLDRAPALIGGNPGQGKTYASGPS